MSVDFESLVLVVVFILSVYYFFFLDSKPKRKSPTPALKKPVEKPYHFINSRKKKSLKNLITDKNTLILFYGSQTGTAEDLAKRFYKQASGDLGLKTIVCDFEDFDYQELSLISGNVVVGFFMATYGEGEPTDNASEFYEWIMEGGGKIDDEGDDSGHFDFSNLNYFVFALGNKTYQFYNAIGRRLDKKLSTNGARKVADRGEGDDDGNMEDDFLNWKKSAISQLASFYGVSAENSAKKNRNVPHVPAYQLVSGKSALFKGEYGTTPRKFSLENGYFSENPTPIVDMKHPCYAPMTVGYDLFSGSIEQFDCKGLVPSSGPGFHLFSVKNGKIEVDRKCFHIEIKLPSNLLYKTGDHLGLWPSNDDHQVGRLVKLLRADLDQVIAFNEKVGWPTPASLETVLRHYVDLNATLKQDDLEVIAKYTADSSEKHKLYQLIDDRALFIEFVENSQKTLIELWEEFESIKIPVQVVLTELLPKISLRYYSISSSALVQPTTVSITAIVVRYALVVRSIKNPAHSKVVLKQGLATSWLERLVKLNQSIGILQNAPHNSMVNPIENYIPSYIRHSTFKLPKDPRVPIVMIGPGTGLAPFRGFVLERQKQAKDGVSVGPAMLFFGCRHPDRDYLYRNELEALSREKAFDFTLVTAFSRFSQSKVYVQHRLKEYASTIWDLIHNKKGYFYVCGDAKHMAKDVLQELVNIAQAFGGMDLTSAQEYVKQLKHDSRYQEDVWA